MSLKLLIKNLNVTNLEKNFTKEIDSINTNTNVHDALKLIFQNTDLDISKIELIYRGEILNKSKALNEYLNSNQASLFLIENQTLIENKNEPSKHEINSLINHINNLFRSKNRRNILEKLLEDKPRLNEVLKTNINELKNDPFSFNFIQSYDLMKLLTDPKKVEGLFQSHPNVFYGAKLLVDYVREMSKKGQTDENFIAKGSYSIDEMSEDEEQNQPNFSMVPNAPRPQAPAITQDHLSAVLNLLSQQQRPPQQQQQAPSQPIIPPAQSQSQGLDRSYFQNVMQQIMGQTNPGATQPTTSAASSFPNQAQPQASRSATSDEEIAAKLEQMHELGFFDDELNLRALQITEMNVEAAISLIIEGGDLI